MGLQGGELNFGLENKGRVGDTGKGCGRFGSSTFGTNRRHQWSPDIPVASWMGWQGLPMGFCAGGGQAGHSPAETLPCNLGGLNMT